MLTHDNINSYTSIIENKKIRSNSTYTIVLYLNEEIHSLYYHDTNFSREINVNIDFAKDKEKTALCLTNVDDGFYVSKQSF